MAPDPIVQERVYRALKADLRSGYLLPGDPAEILGLSRRYGSSETPVREAGWRSVGERLLEPAPYGGFRVSLLTPTGLRHLYQWNAQHLSAALRVSAREALIDAVARAATLSHEGADDLAQLTAELFRAISAATGNAEFVATGDRLNDRLSGVRLVEGRAVLDARQELITLSLLAASGIQNALRKAVLRYHQRRAERAEAIVGALGELKDGR